MKKKGLFVVLVILVLLSVGFVYGVVLGKIGDCNPGFTCSKDGTKCSNSQGDAFICSYGYFCGSNFNSGSLNSCVEKYDNKEGCTKDHECKSDSCIKSVDNEGKISEIGVCVTKYGTQCQSDDHCVYGKCLLGPEGVGNCINSGYWIGDCSSEAIACGSVNDLTKRTFCELASESQKSNKICAQDYYCNEQKIRGGKPSIFSCVEKKNDGSQCSKGDECKNGWCKNNICLSNDYFIGECLQFFSCSDDKTKCISPPPLNYEQECAPGYSCVQTGSVASCSPDITKLDDIYGNIFGGAEVPDGTPCLLSSKCASGNCYSPSSSYVGFCIGDDYWVGSCGSTQNGWSCSGDKNCAKTAGNEILEEKTCATNYYCGLISFGGQLSAVCNEKKDTDELCTTHKECKSDFCETNKCKEKSDDGQECNGDNGCISGRCEETIGKCLGLNYWVGDCNEQSNGCTELGDACTHNGEIAEKCADNYYCGSPALGHLACLPKLEDTSSCEEDYECGSNNCENGLCSGCSSDNDCDSGICNTETGVCETPSGGCELDAECDNNQECVDNACQTITPCETTDECGPGQACFLDVGFGGKCQQCDSTQDCSDSCIGTTSDECSNLDLGTSCAELDGMVCDTNSGYTCIGEISEQATELGCCVATAQDENPGCSSPPIFLGGQSVRFDKECLGDGQAKITILKTGCTPSFQDDCKPDSENLELLGISSNPYYEQDYSCGGIDFGDSEAGELVPAYSLIAIILSLGSITLFYLFRRKN